LHTSLNKGAWRLAVTAAAVTAAAVALAGCSSSGGNNGSGGTGAGSAAATGPTPTGSPIKIGLIASLSGAQAPSSNQGATVAPAWADYVNKQLGGINGHPVQVIVKDDQGAPAPAAAAANDLISQHVAAILVGSDNLLPAYADAVVTAGIPLVSGTANSQPWYSKPGLFPTVTDVYSIVLAQAKVAKDVGHANKMAQLYCAEIAACKESIPILEGAAKKLGMDITSLAVSATATSYTAQCLALKQAGVDYAELNFSAGAAVKFVKDCQAQGFNPTWGVTQNALNVDFLKLSNFTSYGPAPAFPSSASSPAIDTYNMAMQKYAKDDNWKAGTAEMDYAGLVAIQNALAGVSKTATVTAKDVTQDLYGIKNQTLNGLVPNPITFTQGKPVQPGSRPCVYVVGVKDKKFTAPNGLKTECVTDLLK
jgi:branched-chain amino acid transport system substrate-binding protein